MASIGSFGSARRTIAAALALLATGGLAAATATGQGRVERVTIIRDRFGVPHVYAPSAEAVSFGAGYALAQDRLWQMHVYRTATKGKLSSLLGPVVVDMDRAVRAETYTEAERAARFAGFRPDLQRQLEAFADGVNTWITEVSTHPEKLPLEFAEFGVLPIPRWTVDDSMALADFLVLTFGAGGGNELENAALLQRLVERLGRRKGQAAFADLVRTHNPESPVTIPPELDWERTRVHARRRAVERGRALERDARISLAPGATATGARPASREPAAIGTAEQAALVPDAGKVVDEVRRHTRALRSALGMFSFGSNAQIVGPSLASARNSLQTGGPQVDYAVPQYLVDIGLHGGGLDATGMTFAGAGPAVLIGRGPGYAWTTTTGSSDLSDTYVERLDPSDPRRYRFKGRWEPMDCRTETYDFRGVPFQSEEICRTRHGLVIATDEENGVAYSRRNAWFNREGQTITGFFDYNRVGSMRDFASAASLLASNHNMFYVDDRGHYGYWHPGNHPVRKPGVDLRLPQDGTGGSEWRGLLPIRKVPHAVDFDRGWLANWNNKPAEGWHRERAWEARDDVVDLEAAFLEPRTPDPFGGRVNKGRKWSYEDLNANLRHAALAEHRATFFRSALPRPGDLEGGHVARRALELVEAWEGHLEDRDGDLRWDDAGIPILRRWLSLLRERVFADDVGEESLGVVRIDSELWQAVSPDAEVDQRYDWLGKQTRRRAVAAAFDDAVAELASEQGDSPRGWRSDAEIQTYTRLNADLVRDLLTSTSCDALELGDCPLSPDRTRDSGFPGDIPEHPVMDRGTYNHIVAYRGRPRKGRPLGRAPVRAGSVIPPGQSGFVSVLGQEDEHFEDQLRLYREWRYKPMPLTRADALRVAESTESVDYRP